MRPHKAASRSSGLSCDLCAKPIMLFKIPEVSSRRAEYRHCESPLLNNVNFTKAKIDYHVDLQV